MFGVALLACTLLALADARIYERCDLARELLSLGIKREDLATWVCIAFHESRFDTAARNPYSGDHGLLQISELYWCGAGKACGLPCSALRDDDISDDVDCALRVHEEHTRLQGNGFLAWVVYPQHCKHNAKKYLADCGSSVKTSSVRTDGRARVLKPQNRNSTIASYNPKIDELLPPYLTVGSFLRGSYEKEFEQNYNNKVRVNWLTYKIHNIDDLKLPVFNQEVRGRYTTTTLTSTTSTTPSPLPHIKPPSPRRIESNSFRRRKMRPILETVKFSETTDLAITPKTVLLTTITPRNQHISRETYVPQRNIIQYTTSTTAPSTKTDYLSSLFTSSTTQTTKLPKSHTSTTILTTLTQSMSTISNLEKLSTVTEKSLKNEASTESSMDRTQMSTIKPEHYGKPENEKQSPIFAGNKKVVSENKVIGDERVVDIPEVRNISINKSDSKLPSSTPRAVRIWPSWRTPSLPEIKTTTTSTTTKPKSLTVARRTSKPWSSALSGTFNRNIITKSFDQHNARTSRTTTENWLHSKILPSQLSSSNNVTRLASNLLVQSTTRNPRATWPAANSRSSPSPATVYSTSVSLNNIVTSTPFPTTAKTTQSIFDLYLKPTKRPPLSAYTLPPFKNSVFSLRIFAGGTTTHSPSILSEVPDAKPKNDANNTTRRQARQFI